ncbi:YeiH family protein [Acidovorax sp. MR-S7]|uniref:YeiH family protein n=1 Tax=Acidovorax sp. MR-S7 TaxID=1268622 RepID=UPI0003D3D2DD|nr:putative sulfate exporter family transporter [Acidovorax sp. MR-S7]GAD24616.1 predicted membrane protein [Acidovorax sp. MR-S7]
MSTRRPLVHLLPGLALCGAVTLVSLGLEHVEAALTGRAWLEALVLSIVIGTLLRTAWKPPASFEPGIQCAAKTLMEAAVMLMGATVSFGAILQAGTPLLAGIVLTVFATIAVSFSLGRFFGLPAKMAALVACGNSICGNSAIAAVAPAIDADSRDVTTAIAFTAVLGIVVVLLIPVIAHVLHLNAAASGVLAGLTVYAVPQVLAAAAPMGAAAVQVGTLVKLIRVLMLGPVVATLSILYARSRRSEPRQAAPRRSLTQYLPVFILVFLALALIRSIGLLPQALVAPASSLSGLLTIVAMAGLGLGVDLRSVTAAGPRVSIVVTLSLVVLGGFAMLVLHALKLA